MWETDGTLSKFSALKTINTDGLLSKTYMSQHSLLGVTGLMDYIWDLPQNYECLVTGADGEINENSRRTNVNR